MAQWAVNTEWLVERYDYWSCFNSIILPAIQGFQQLITASLRYGQPLDSKQEDYWLYCVSQQSGEAFSPRCDQLTLLTITRSKYRGENTLWNKFKKNSRHFILQAL